MGARKKRKVNRCGECGAELRHGPARCPLCGAEASAAKAASSEPAIEDYQTNVRDLREQLRRLREESAEAV